MFVSLDDFIDYVKREIQEMKDEIANLKKSDSKSSFASSLLNFMKHQIFDVSKYSISLECNS